MKIPKLDGNFENIFSVPKYAQCYANLAEQRIIFVSEDITKEVSSILSALFFYYDNKNDVDDIILYINTNGGDADALANIYDVMQMIKSPIKTICIGKAYSAGVFMLAAGTKGKRYMTKNSTVMMHGLQCDFPGQGEDQRNSQIYYDHLTKSNKKIITLLAKHTGQTYEKVNEDCKKDNFLDAQEALAYGIADHII